MREPHHISKSLISFSMGGYIKPSSILIAGSCGTGKTNMCMQSLFNAAEQGEKCAYVSLLSESEDKIIRALSSFSFYNEELMNDKVKICSISSDVIAKGDFAIFEYLNDNILKNKISRIVIDTINILEDIESTFDERPFHKYELRSFVLNLFHEFNEKNMLLIATAEIPASSINSSLWPYMFDTVISLDTVSEEEKAQRYLEIIKERGSDFSMGKHKFSITKNGIIL